MDIITCISWWIGKQGREAESNHVVRLLVSNECPYRLSGGQTERQIVRGHGVN